MSMNMPDYYQLLGVARNATPDEIKAAYDRLALQRQSAEGQTPDTKEWFKEVEIAYSVLMDPDKRAIYDLTLPAEVPSAGGACPVSSAALGQVPWSLSDVMLGLVLLVATQIGVGLFVAVGVLVTMMLHGGTMSGATDVLVFTALQIGELLMFAIAWLFGVVKYHARWSSLGFRVPAGGSALGWLSLTVLGMFAVALFYGIVVNGLGAKSLQPGPPIPSYLLGSSWSNAALILLAVLVAPFCEETLFRGFVFGGLNKRLGFVWGAVISAALFAGAHASLAALVPIFFLGLLLAALYKKTGSIWLCMIAHGVYNGLAVMAFLTKLPF